MSGLLNKLTGNTNTANTSTTAGPHDSNVANKLDPRVDSDLDGSRNAGVRRDGNMGHNTAGPHQSNVANKMDPRVDSDLDGSRNAGMKGGVNAPTSSTHGSTNAGPHSSNAANKLDPRVDSDRDGRGVHGTHAGTGGGLGSSHTAGSTNYGYVSSHFNHDCRMIANRLL